MDRRQRGEQLFYRLVQHGSTVPARVFPKSSTWSWLRDPAKAPSAAGLFRTGLGMLQIDPITYGLEKLGGLGLRAFGKLPLLSTNTLLPGEVAATTLGSRAALASGLAGGLMAGAGAFMGIWGGMARVGQAKLEGQRIAQARLAIGAYANKYAETLAGYANALDGPSAYQPKVAADLPAWLKPWQQRAITDAHAALKALGEQDGRAVLRHLKDFYREPRAIARALRQGVLHHSLKHVSPQLRRFLNLTGELGGGTKARAGRPQPKVEQGVQIDADTVYWPKRNATEIRFTKPSVTDRRELQRSTRRSRPFDWRSDAIPPRRLQRTVRPDRPGQPGWGMVITRSKPFDWRSNAIPPAHLQGTVRPDRPGQPGWGMVITRSKPYDWRSNAIPPAHLQDTFRPDRPGQPGWGMTITRSKPFDWGSNAIPSGRLQHTFRPDRPGQPGWGMAITRSQPFDWGSNAIPPKRLQNTVRLDRPGQAGWGMIITRSRPNMPQPGSLSRMAQGLR